MSPLPFGEFRERIDTLYATGAHAASTRSRMRQVLRELAGQGCRTTAGLTTAAMARYVAARGPKANPNTTNGYLSAIAAACTYAVEERWLDHAPAWRRVRLRKAKMTRNQPPPFVDVSRLLATARAWFGDTGAGWEDRRLAALVWTVALTGVRRDEALYLRREDVDVEGRRIVIDPRRRLKTEASARTVPMPDGLAEVLAEWLPAAGSEWCFPGVRGRGPWTGGSVAGRPLGRLKAVAASVGIDRITWHSLRHAYGTAAVGEWDAPVWVVQRYMGHTDARTTAGYLHLDDAPALAQTARSFAYG
jgi:integrase